MSLILTFVVMSRCETHLSALIRSLPPIAVKFIPLVWITARSRVTLKDRAKVGAWSVTRVRRRGHGATKLRRSRRWYQHCANLAHFGFFNLRVKADVTRVSCAVFRDSRHFLRVQKSPDDMRTPRRYHLSKCPGSGRCLNERHVLAAGCLENVAVL